MQYDTLAIKDATELIFGRSPNPVTTSTGLQIGTGSVVPELNFTLPTMTVNASTRNEVVGIYRQIATDALERAYELQQAQVVLEFETLLEMTNDPSLGVEIVAAMREVSDSARASRGTRSAIRLTPNDTRDFDKPLRMRSSPRLDTMLELFEAGARAGGDLLSIESTGGKELHDDALMYCDIRGMVFALAVLGVRDVHFLWQKIVDIADKTGCVAGGDTACGFANTAMVLAEKQYIPRVVAAVDRAISIVRTLGAVEEGARGPDKDCGYEGPYLKAIAGIPISMEGKTAACAHLSPVGNITAACCDLWSNESVNNVQLLSGMAPTAYLEQLVYDTRLMNRALEGGSASTLQSLYVASDAALDPQALILAPESVLRIAGSIVAAKNHVAAAVAAATTAIDIIEEAAQEGQLSLPDREAAWIPGIREQLATVPEAEGRFIEEMMPELEGTAVVLGEYGL
ncbi:MAG: methanol--corrinoid methyltransferase [Spirochaetes bacterium]|jgi:methanol--5-hydroxybenzimidazolylcobamide Co-methyltransferase|nr:methanol--corrinoid methyltransferase [Spirochaetota bacterium]